MAEPILRMENISKSFGPVRALSDVSIELYPGEVLALMGENGAGKSTLMNVLSGALLSVSTAIQVAPAGGLFQLEEAYNSLLDAMQRDASRPAAVEQAAAYIQRNFSRSVRLQNQPRPLVLANKYNLLDAERIKVHNATASDITTSDSSTVQEKLDEHDLQLSEIANMVATDFPGSAFTGLFL